MAGLISKARVGLKKAQVRYKENFFSRMRRENEDIVEGDFVWLNVQDGNSMEKLGGKTDGPFEVLRRTTLTFVIIRGRVVVRVNSDLDVKSPKTVDENSQRGGLDRTAADLRDKNTERCAWFDHRTLLYRTGEAREVEFHVEWVGDYEPTW